MPVSFVEAKTGKSTSTTSYAVPIPAHQAKDLLILSIWYGSNGQTPDTPSGWTLAIGQANLEYKSFFVYYKLATVNSAATTQSMTVGSGPYGEDWVTVSSVWRGVHQINPVVDAKISWTNTAVGYVDAPAVNAGSAIDPLRLVTTGRVSNGAAYPTPSGWTQRAIASGSSGDFHKVQVFDRTVYSGSEQRFDSGSNGVDFGVSLAIQSAPVGGPRMMV